jgi:hypothetical protein
VCDEAIEPGPHIYVSASRLNLVHTYYQRAASARSNSYQCRAGWKISISLGAGAASGRAERLANSNYSGVRTDGPGVVLRTRAKIGSGYLKMNIDERGSANRERSNIFAETHEMKQQSLKQLECSIVEHVAFWFRAQRPSVAPPAPT